jgi:hypothetical protein
MPDTGKKEEQQKNQTKDKAQGNRNVKKIKKISESAKR